MQIVVLSLAGLSVPADSSAESSCLSVPAEWKTELSCLSVPAGVQCRVEDRIELPECAGMCVMQIAVLSLAA
eukprot:1160577-Pelagomonas_calceolata.AAC.2